MSKKISDFFKIETKNSKFEELEIRECRVILHDINKDIQNKELKSSHKAVKNGNKDSSVIQRRSVPGQKQSKTAPERSNIPCEACNQEFKRINSLRLHMAKKHPETASEPKSFECDFDGKIFKSRGEILRHMKCHQQKVKCVLCQIEVLPKTMRQHMLIHINERKFQCKICQNNFKSIRALNQHIKSHNKKFGCQKCSKMFPTRGHLNQHIKYTHENPRSFKCEICGKKFNEKRTWQSHQRIHDKNRPKPYKCQRCDYASDRKGHFKIHEKTHENQDKKFGEIKNPLKCEKCAAYCENKQRLYMHMKVVHPEAPFQCDLCVKYIKNKFHLINHIKNRICQKLKF